MENKEQIMQELHETSRIFNEAIKEMEKEQEDYWNGLSKEDQLKCFCAVVRRIHKGDIELNGTYRYVLYDVFEFGPESYMPAQLAGYMAIHNSIFDGERERQTLEEFAKALGAEDAKDLVDKFYTKDL